MFNSDSKNGLLQPKPGPLPLGSGGLQPPRQIPTAPSQSPFDRSTSASSGTSVIGTDLTILGERITIISANRLQVDGDVRGNVHGKQVVITEEGSVTGTVCAEEIEVRGGVRGAIRAVTVKLHATAKVEGDVTHQNLAIEEGAQFDGRVRRSNDRAELMPVLDPEVIERSRTDNDVSASQ